MRGDFKKVFLPDAPEPEPGTVLFLSLLENLPLVSPPAVVPFFTSPEARDSPAISWLTGYTLLRVLLGDTPAVSLSLPSGCTLGSAFTV